MCWQIGQVKVVDVCHDLCAQYHILVQLDDSHHHIYCLGKLGFFALCQNGKEQVGQPVVVDTAS